MIALLKIKWIVPIVEGIRGLSIETITKLKSRVDSLVQKYSDTFENIENEIDKVEKELVDMLSDLSGDESDMAGIAELSKILGGE